METPHPPDEALVEGLTPMFAWDPDLVTPLPDEAATWRMGEWFARLARAGDVIALHGDLGAGKTTLARAFIRALTSPLEDVPSPTFTLVQTYDAPHFQIWHFDLYRLTDPREARELGLEETSAGVALIEWPERLGDLLPRQRLDVHLGYSDTGSETGRILRGVDRHDWSSRVRSS